MQIRRTHKGYATAKIGCGSHPHPLLAKRRIYAVGKITGVAHDGVYDGHFLPVVGVIQVGNMEGRIVPTVGISPPAITDQLDTLIDGLLNGIGARVTGGVKHRIHLRVSEIQEPIAKPAAHQNRGGGAKTALSVVARNRESSLHPGGIFHKGLGFIADGLGGHHQKFHDIIEREPTHQHLREIVISVQQRVVLIIGVVFRILRRGEEVCGDGIGAHRIAK